jgi:hypothetical protein
MSFQKTLMNVMTNLYKQMHTNSNIISDKMVYVNVYININVFDNRIIVENESSLKISME